LFLKLTHPFRYNVSSETVNLISKITRISIYLVVEVAKYKKVVFV